MILFQSGLIRIDYDPATDILSVDMPHVDVLTLPEVKESLHIIVENIRNYDVKQLLVDARHNEVAVDEESYITLIRKFSEDLLTTRLERVARIVTSSDVRESVVQKVYSHKPLQLEFKNFTDAQSAIDWLKS